MNYYRFDFDLETGITRMTSNAGNVPTESDKKTGVVWNMDELEKGELVGHFIIMSHDEELARQQAEKYFRKTLDKINNIPKLKADGPHLYVPFDMNNENERKMLALYAARMVKSSPVISADIYRALKDGVLLGG